MSLKSIRFIQRLIGVILLVYGIYLIFGTQDFFGTLLIILAFLIFPSLHNKKSRSHSQDYVHDRSNDSAFDNDNSNSYGSGESDGDSGGD
jgi:hypothetical protein